MRLEVLRRILAGFRRTIRSGAPFSGTWLRSWSGVGRGRAAVGLDEEPLRNHAAQSLAGGEVVVFVLAAQLALGDLFFRGGAFGGTHGGVESGEGVADGLGAGGERRGVGCQRVGRAQRADFGGQRLDCGRFLGERQVHDRAETAVGEQHGHHARAEVVAVIGQVGNLLAVKCLKGSTVGRHFQRVPGLAEVA